MTRGRKYQASKSYARHAVAYELCVAGRALREQGPQGKRTAVLCLKCAETFQLRPDELREVRRALESGLSNSMGFVLVQSLWNRVLDGQKAPLTEIDFSHMAEIPPACGAAGRTAGA